MIDPKDAEANRESTPDEEEIEVASETVADLEATDEESDAAKGGLRSAACMT